MRFTERQFQAAFAVLHAHAAALLAFAIVLHVLASRQHAQNYMDLD